MESLHLPDVLPSFDYEVVVAAAENTCSHVGILNFRLEFSGGLLCPFDIADEIVVEDELSGVAVVFVLVLWNYAALLVDLKVLPVYVEGRETSLVALLLFPVVLWTDDLLEILLKAFIEGHFHSGEGIFSLVEDDAVSADVSLYLLFGVSLLGD